MAPRPSSPSPLVKGPRKSAPASTSAGSNGTEENKLKKALKYPKRKAVDVKRSLSQTHLPTSSTTSLRSNPTSSARPSSHHPSASASSFVIPPAPGSVTSEPPTRIPSKLRKKSGDLRREKSIELKEKRSSGFARVLGRNKSVDVLSSTAKPEQKRQISQPIVDFNSAHPSSQPSSSRPSPPLGASSRSSVFSNHGSHTGGLGEPWVERSSMDGPGVLGSPVSFSPSLPSLASPPRKLIPREARGSMSPNKRQSFTDTASVLSSPGMGRPGRQVSVKIVDAPGHEPVSMAEFFANDSDFSDSEDEAEPAAQREPRRQPSQASVSSKGSKGRMRRISSGFSKLNKSLHDLGTGGGSGGSGDREKDASLASRFNKSLHNLADNYIVKPEKSDRTRESSPPFELQPASVAGSSNSSLHPTTPPRKGPRRSASLMTKFNKSLHDLADTLKPEEIPEYEGGAKVSRRHSYIPRLVRSLSRNPSHASTGSLSPAHSALVPPSPGESYSAQSSIMLESEPSLQFEPLVEEPEPAEITEQAGGEDASATEPPVSMVPTSPRTPDGKPVTTPSSPLHSLPPVSPRFASPASHSHARTPSSPGRTHDSLGIDFGVLLAEGRASTEVEIGHGDDVPRPTVRRGRGYTLSKSDAPFSAEEAEHGELERLSGRVLSKEEARRSIVSVAASEREMLRGLTTKGEEMSRPETARPLEIAHAETLDQLVASQNSEKPDSPEEPAAELQHEIEHGERKELRRGTSLESSSVHSVELSTPAEEIVPVYEAHIPATIQEEVKQTHYSSVSPAFAQALPSFDPVSPLKMNALLEPEPVAFIQPLAQPQPIATQPLVDDSHLESSTERVKNVDDDEEGEARRLKRESTFEDLAQHYVSAPEPDAQHIETTSEVSATFPPHTVQEHECMAAEEAYDLETTFAGSPAIDARASPVFPSRSTVASPLPVPEEIPELAEAETPAIGAESIKDDFVHELDEELEIAKLQDEEEPRLERMVSPATIETIEELPSPEFDMDEFATPAGIDYSASPAEEEETEYATPTEVIETVLTRSVGGAEEYGDVEAVSDPVETAGETPDQAELEEPEDTGSLFEGTSALEAAAVASVAVAAPIAAFAAVSPAPAPHAPEYESTAEAEPIEVDEPEPVVQSSPAISKNAQLLKAAIEVPREVVQSSPAIERNTQLLTSAINIPRIVPQSGPGITKNTQLLKNAINVPRQVVQFSPAIALLDELLRKQICVPREVTQCSAAIDWNTQLIMEKIAVPRDLPQSGAGIEKNTQLLKDAINVPREVSQTGVGIEKNDRLLHEAIEVPRDVPQTGTGIERNTALLKNAIAVPRDVPQSGPGIERNEALLKHALHDIPAEERWNYHPVEQDSPAIRKNTALLKSAINVPRQVVQFSPAIQLLDQLLKAQICVPREVPQSGPGIEKNEALLKHAILDVPMEERWDYHPVEQEGPGIATNVALLKQAIEVPRQVSQSGKGIDTNIALLKQAIEVPREVVQSSPGIDKNTALLREAIAVPREVVQSSPGISKNMQLLQDAINVPREVIQASPAIETNTALLKQAIEVPREVPQTGLGIELNEKLLREAILAPSEKEAEDAHSEASTPADEIVTPPTEDSAAIELNESLLRDAICKPAPAASHSRSVSAASSVKSRASSMASVHSRSASQPNTPPSPVKSLIEQFEAAEVDALPLVAAEPPYSPPIERVRTLSFEKPASEADDEASVDGAEDNESVRDDADVAVPGASTDRPSTAASTSTSVVSSDLDASNAVPCDGGSQGGEEPEATGAKEERPEDSEEGGLTEALAQSSCEPGEPGEPGHALAPATPAVPATNEHEPPAETSSFAQLDSSHSSSVIETPVPDTDTDKHAHEHTDELTAPAEKHNLDDNLVHPGVSFAAVASHPPSTDPSSHPPSTTSDMAASPVVTATATTPRADVVVEVNPAPAASAPAPVPVVATPVPIVHATTAPVEHCHVDHTRDALSAKAERIRAERAREADELWPHERPPLRYASPGPAPAAAAATIVLPSITVQAPTPAQSLHHAPVKVLTKNQKKKARQKAKRQAARAATTDSDTSSVVSSHHSHHAKSKKKGVEVEAEGVKITVNADKEAKEKREREEREAREKKEKEEREAREKKEKEEREAREKKEKEEREAREKKEKEEREAKEKKEKEEREAKENKEREEREAREKKEREEREAKEKKEREEREAREKKERELAAAEAKLAAERAAAEAAALKAAEEAKAAAEKAEREAREAKEAEEKAAAEKAAAEAAAEKERKEKEREERRRLRAEREDLLRQELEIRKRELERAQYAEQLMAQQAAHAGPWRPPMPYGVPPPGLGFAGLNLGLPPYAARFPAPHPMMGPLGPIFHHPPGGFMPPPPGPGPRRF